MKKCTFLIHFWHTLLPYFTLCYNIMPFLTTIMTTSVHLLIVFMILCSPDLCSFETSTPVTCGVLVNGTPICPCHARFLRSLTSFLGHRSGSHSSKRIMKTNQDVRNFQIVARGNRISEIDETAIHDNTFLVGFRHIQLWWPPTQSWISISTDADKFLISCEDKETGWSEFWTRWKKFVNRVYHRQFIPIETI